ncbi:MAG: PQQ-binding-like beta-propeller repeat protein, partial [Methanosarcinales archaeon]
MEHYLVESSPAVANGIVYIGSGDNYVYAFATEAMVDAPYAISSAQSAINSANNMDADTSHSQQLLQKAQNAYKNNQYQNATNYAKQAEESANVSINIIQAKSAINSANSIGADTSHSNQLLQKAQNALKNGKYSDAINYAEQAKESANNAKTTRYIQYAFAIILFVFIAFGYIKATEKIREQKRIAREFQRRFKEHL